MNKHINLSCISSLDTSCVESATASSSDEGKVIAPLTAEGQLAINENASTVRIAPNLCALLDLSVAVQEGDECVRDFLDQLSGHESAESHLV